MTSLLNTQTCVGKSVQSKKVVRAALGDYYSSEHAIFNGAPEDKDGLYFTAGLMKDGKRSYESLVHCTLIAIDIDELTDKQSQRIQFMLDQSGYEYILYTTTNHRPDSPRFRVILNPSRPTTIEEYKYVVHKLSTELSIDKRCNASNTPSTPMFLPLVVAETYAHRINEHVAGKKVDIDALVKTIDHDPEWENIQSGGDTLEPMAIPGGLPEDNWLNNILLSYPAKGLKYDEWLEVGFALHHQTDARKFDLWYQWSKLNDEMHGRKYDREAMQYKWNSAKSDPTNRGTTLRNILNKKNSSKRTILALSYRGMLNELQEPEHLSNLVNDIQADDFVQQGDYRIIASAVKAASVRINNDQLTTGEAMQMIRKEHRIRENDTYYYDNYLFSERESQYYNINTKQPVSIVSMNYKYGSRMPLSNSGERKVVHKVLSNASNGIVSPRMMSGMVYDLNTGPVVTEHGQFYLNQFDPDSWPNYDQDWDVEGNALDAEVRAMIHSHVKLLCNGDPKVMRLILQHLAHLRQQPMKRIHFAYAISSYFHGVGKSTLAKLYQKVLGKKQVNLLAAANIKEDYNAYAAAPHLMSFIEEFEFDTRREQNTAIKKMKDLITNDQVSLRKMRTDAHTARTYTAYALFSNDEYVLGHESTGRRWVPIIVDSLNKEQCSTLLGMDHTQFYNRYNELMDNHADRFVAYFDQLSLEGFNSEKPPETAFKHMFIESVPAARTARVLREIIEDSLTTDITDSYTSANAALVQLRNYIDLNTTGDADELKVHNARTLRSLTTQALKMMGYRLMSNDNSRFRLPFTDRERTRLNDIWIKDHHKYGGVTKVDDFRRHMNTLIERRQYEQEERREQKVVTMQGKPYEDI